MGADISIIVEHRMVSDAYQKRVWQWGLVEAQFAFHRDGDLDTWICDALPEKRDGDTEQALVENFWGHRYADGEKRKARAVWLPPDTGPTTLKLLAEEAFDAYWIRVASGQWLVDFVANKPWQTTSSGPTHEFEPNPKYGAPESFVRLAALVSSLLALKHDVRVYLSYGQ
jgi:hypothetical protein